MKTYETIIVGGGMSGLGCAANLAKNGYKNFILISPEIGGRVHSSDDGEVNYGAFYFRSDYKNTKQFFIPTKRITLGEMGIFKEHKKHQLSSYFIKNPFASLKLFYELYKFNWHYQSFKRKCEKLSQKEAIDQDIYLSDLQRTSTYEYVKAKGLTNIYHNIIAAVVGATGYINPDKTNAADFLRSMLVFIHPTYEFLFLKEKIIQTFFDQIENDEILKIRKSKEGYFLIGRKKKYFCRNLIMATPINISKKLLKKPFKINPKQNADVYHVRGILRHPYVEDSYIKLSNRSREAVIAKEPNGTSAVYTHNPSINLKKYFKDYQIIKIFKWRPAFFLGNNFIESKLDKNLWIIGDYNICGMEDAYITGIYASNQIVNNTKNN